MKATKPCILTINGGSSSIKFALFRAGQRLDLILHGCLEGVGLTSGRFTVKGLNEADGFSNGVKMPDHEAAAALLMDWLRERTAATELKAVGHRVVYGGWKYGGPVRITAEVIEGLKSLSPLDPDHSPEEILLIEAFHLRFPDLSQFACFDSAFHHDMPRVASMLPIPRRYSAQGLRRYGFHGLSYAFLMEELERFGSADGRVILAHLGSGASMAAVLNGRSIDTTMALTPAAGLVMGTRSGDIDPGLVAYLARSEKMSPAKFGRMINHESGLLGVSEISSDVRELLAKETSDTGAAEALALFCYQAKKWIGAYAAALGGLDTLVFSGGIGENSPPIRARICESLAFLGIEVDDALNRESAHLISSGRVTVRVIKTNEELMISRTVWDLLEDNQTKSRKC